MKNRIIFVALMSLTFVSCSKDNGKEKENTKDLPLAQRVAADLIKVKGGTFIMGQTTSGLITKAESSSEDTNDPRPDELPLHRVSLSDFEISRFEVTQKLWEEVMGTPEPRRSDPDPSKAMDGVSWQDAMDFIDRLNSLTGENYRLPTEAEWEYAARGGIYSCDYRYSGSNDWSEVAWCKEDGVGGMQAVGLKKANELGLFDMSGNAFEWCYDWYGAYSAEDQFNPKGPSEDEKMYSYAGSQVSAHVLRGGHFQSSIFAMRVSFRTKIPTTNYKPKCGFRLAKGISYDEMNNYSPGTASNDVANSDFSKESGIFAGKTVNYRKLVLGTKDNPAVCLYLHGGSSRGNDNESQLKEKAVGTISAYLRNNGINSILLVPQCDADGSWGGAMREPLKKLTESYAEDGNEVYCFGGSMGGTGTWALVSYCPGLFTAAMPVAGNPGGCIAENFVSTRICTVMGTADNLMKIEPVESFIEQLGACGVVSRFETEEGWSHARTCEDSYTEDRLDWVFGK